MKLLFQRMHFDCIYFTLLHYPHKRIIFLTCCIDFQLQAR